MRASERLRLLLSRLARPGGRTDPTGAVVLTLTLTREELAQAIGTTPQHLYRVLRQFVGAIEKLDDSKLKKQLHALSQSVKR
jgi:CRP-like cAMP-binding protein